MKIFIRRALILIGSFNISVIIFLIALFSSGFQFTISALISLITFFTSYSLLKKKFIPNSNLNKIVNKEKKYVAQQMKEAKKKVKEINNARFRVRSIFVFQTINNVYKMSNKVIKMIETEPQRFRDASHFIHQHLDSAAIITDKYVKLVSQPVRDHTIKSSIREAEDGLKSLEKAMERELISILNNDITNLDVELKLIKNSEKNIDSTLKK
ncbi:5-bromo-4-chloroindolyl phosphate hydrolysis family protein [Sutcliffiella cohnii]|uniref:5-bromo-4-chloroindolyl phosphate hydrolysis family protein n=1 Tax=Sutcliffiella cohnii TaxID=33932 RepID=UPI002E21A121|nr:5-bromo-4-chloroindolyl phosphate hydrolysis family protein [Sutcliffiella cohnii]